MQRKRRRLVRISLTAMALTATAALAACGGGGSGQSSGEAGVVRVGALVDVQSFDPAQNPGQGQRLFLDPVYDRLLTTDAAGNVEAGVATEWELTADALTLTLESGRSFSDGTPLDGEAVKASIEHAQQTAGPAASALASVDEVIVDGPEQVTLSLSEPAPSLPLALTDVAGMLVSPAALGNDDLGTAPVGSGPYVLDVTATKKGVSYVYTPNEEYDDEEVQTLERIEIDVLTDAAARANALTAGQIDVAQVDRSQLTSIESTDLESGTIEGNHWMLQFTDIEGTLAPALASEQIRQAIGYAVDRDAIVETAFFGQGSGTPQPFGEDSAFHVAGLEDSYSYDPDRARQLVEDSGVSDPSFTVPTFAVFQPIAEAVQASLKEVGIDMGIELIQPGTLDQENRSTNYPAILTPIKEIHPEQLYDYRLAADGPLNPFGVANAAVDEAHQAALAAGDDAAYADMLTAVSEQALWVDLFTDDVTVAWSPSLEGVELVEGWAMGPSLRGVTKN